MSTYRATGTTASNNDSSALAPGAPTGKAVGDLLILYTGNRAAAQSIASLATDWTQVGAVTDNNSLEIWVRIADGSASDTPSPDWTGTNDSWAWIEAWSDHSYTDLATIVQDVAASENSAGNANLVLPARTVSADNALLIAATSKHKTVTSNDATTVTMPAGLTKRRDLVMSGTALVVASAATQQTTATNFGGSNATVDGTAESAPTAGLVLTLKTGNPVFTVNPTVTSQTTNAYTIGGTTGGSVTVSAVAVAKDSAAPSIAQVVAGQNGAGGAAIATVSETWNGANDFVLGGSLVFPIHDLYVTDGTSLITLADEALDIPAGKQRLTLTSVHATSPYTGQGVAAGDIATIDSATDPSSYVITDEVDGTISYAAGGGTSRQLIESQVYDVSAAANLDFLFVYNNQSPTASGSVFPDPLLFQKSVAITSINLLPLVADPESDTMVVSALDVLPTGLSITASGNYPLGGTPTVYGTGFYDIEWEDQYGGTYVEAVEIQIGDLVPDVEDVVEATAITTIEAVAGFTAVAGAPVEHPTIAAGRVISTDPAIGVLVPFNQEVTYTTSLGATLFAHARASFTATGSMATIFLGPAVAVPANAVMLGGIAHSQSGWTYVANWPSSNEVYYRAGQAVRSDGAMLITTGPVEIEAGGFGYTQRGELCVTEVAPTTFHNGYGFINGPVSVTAAN